MNSINILTGISSSNSESPGRSRSDSESLQSEKAERDAPRRNSSQNVLMTLAGLASSGEMVPIKQEEEDDAYSIGHSAGSSDPDEKTPLLEDQTVDTFGNDHARSRGIWLLPKSLAAAFVSAVRIVIAMITAPGRYIAGSFYDQEGHFSVVLPIRRLGGTLWYKNPTPTTEPTPGMMAASQMPSGQRSVPQTRSSARIKREQTESSAITSDSEAESQHPDDDTPARNTRSKSASLSNEVIAPSKRSIRIKLSSDDAQKRRKQRSRHMSSNLSEMPTTAEELAAAVMKSPTSPSTTGSTITKYPRAPAPPRPLIPRRQPSYSNNMITTIEMKHEKTLIIDLDETLIHSMSKGGRFTTGHMVEVRMRQTMGVGGITIGPEVPVLYYVHKRPHCDEFLRKVSKWYNLVIFTASVQEYADPVIDWLEMERKYFAKRYYRDHCTFRNGAYIKDLGIVESDLSKVIIIDNSPLSYIFNEDNAIPIEGWISDPTDNDLLHLVPLLEGLQYATDVRAVLSLRLGEPQMA